MDLKEILDHHQRLPIPDFPANSYFAEWVEDLFELDGYYYGVAVSRLNGDRLNCNPEPFLNLKKTFEEFRYSPGDERVFTSCKRYLDSLERIVLATCINS